MWYALPLILCSLFSCGTEDLSNQEQREFENNWWYVDCAFGECPFCFKLEKDHTIKLYDPIYEYQQTSGSWSFEEPNIYYVEYEGKSHKVVVEKDGDCYELTYLFVKFHGCPYDMEIQSEL